MKRMKDVKRRCGNLVERKTPAGSPSRTSRRYKWIISNASRVIDFLICSWSASSRSARREEAADEADDDCGGGGGVGGGFFWGGRGGAEGAAFFGGRGCGAGG